MSDLGDYIIKRPKSFDLAKIFDCGQSFRFFPCGDNCFEGIAYGMYLKISQNYDFVTFHSTDEETYTKIWKNYFSINTSYDDIKNDIISKFGNDITIRKAVETGDGIRILRQEPWETLCTFILSQNNNIPRIRKLVSALSDNLGEKIEIGNRTEHAFPSAKAVADAGTDFLRSLSVGFRAPYLSDAAEKVCSGELAMSDLEKLDTASLTESLMKIKGVGPKVAACTALFGFGKYDSFPIDVWIKRVMSQYYPQGLEISSLGQYAGIAQQYLFYYQRYSIG